MKLSVEFFRKDGHWYFRVDPMPRWLVDELEKEAPIFCLASSKNNLSDDNDCAILYKSTPDRKLALHELPDGFMEEMHRRFMAEILYGTGDEDA